MLLLDQGENWLEEGESQNDKTSHKQSNMQECFVSKCVSNYHVELYSSKLNSNDGQSILNKTQNKIPLISNT